MTPYGSKIRFDATATPIKMTVANDILEVVKSRFDVDYSLPFRVLPSDEDNISTLVFDDSVDAETFLRHLATAAPEEYEGLTA